MKKYKHFNLTKQLKTVSKLNEQEIADNAVDILKQFYADFAEILKEHHAKDKSFFVDGALFLLERIILDEAMADGTLDDIEYGIISRFYSSLGKEVGKKELIEKYDSFSKDSILASILVAKSFSEEMKDFTLLPNALLSLAWSRGISKEEYDKIIYLYDGNKTTLPSSYESFVAYLDKINNK